MPEATVNYLAILKILHQHKVKFIIVGGVCAVLHGAPLATFDLDVVHSREQDNLIRLWTALGKLSALYRTAGRQGQRPGLSDLASTEHQLLMTRFGPLDLLGTTGKGRDYNQLLQDTVEIEIGPALKVRASTLESLVKTKEETGLEMDRAALPLLRRLLEERTKT